MEQQDLTAKKNPNKHIEDFLDYYCTLNESPEYAVLLNGEWGAGKTWFIKKQIEKINLILTEINDDLKSKDNPYWIERTRRGGVPEVHSHFLYISLYGLIECEQIELEIFKQLHPVLSSKSAQTAGKLITSLIRTTLKFDLNLSEKGTFKIGGKINSADLKLPKFLKNADSYILIFDDLERSSIPIEEVLGFINSYVEHGGHKAVIISNETAFNRPKRKQLTSAKTIRIGDKTIEKKLEELITETNSNAAYLNIKEKLIGKTFEIQSNVQSALPAFIEMLPNEAFKKFSQIHISEIYEAHNESQLNNLRLLKRVLLDFGRVHQKLPQDVISNHKLILKLFRYYFFLYYEVNTGKLKQKQLVEIHNGIDRVLLHPMNVEAKDEVFSVIVGKYSHITYKEHLLSGATWVNLLFKNIISTKEIYEELSQTKYFLKDNAPSWMKLFEYDRLSDQEIQAALTLVYDEYVNGSFTQLGDILHATGVLLKFSAEKIFEMSQEEIIKNGKKMVRTLLDRDIIHPLNTAIEFSPEFDNFGGYGFMSSGSTEFKDFQNYLRKSRESKYYESLPDKANELISILKSDTPHLFLQRLVHTNAPDSLYYATPILQYIDQQELINCYLLKSSDTKTAIRGVLKGRYNIEAVRKILKEKELPWLISLQKTLTELQEKIKSKKTVDKITLPYLATSVSQAINYFTAEIN